MPRIVDEDSARRKAAAGTRRTRIDAGPVRPIRIGDTPEQRRQVLMNN
ncbi:MAG: hypothetical protein IT298_10170 [Chloroflexi bacterium]|jgi:hypothetical protein|nr:hypothetical protein [Anaerolineae bacterium]MCC6566116.1 hypothetical protein [Chloroflexota bacterium]MCO6443164.1 hypothetical protein [Anaerolineae bacterium]MEB2366470.1 hypothetical protein [Chloroflexota bacterium]